MKQKEQKTDGEGATSFKELDEELRRFGEYIDAIPVPAETRRLWEQLQFQLVRQLEKQKEKGDDKDRK
ncbi:hypothetical protein [Phyllobacterium phragmitis]|uniref:Anti-sigma factor NepR domain-containing protein n=1 Tax=Phyllobacterium phragmitis TaxID=2670329 RepID=A0ABQ0GUJ7_9HYPH